MAQAEATRCNHLNHAAADILTTVSLPHTPSSLSSAEGTLNNGHRAFLHDEEGFCSLLSGAGNWPTYKARAPITLPCLSRTLMLDEIYAGVLA